MKNRIKFFQENIVFSNFFVAFCVLSLYRVSEILLLIPHSQDMCFFILFCSLASYNFTRIPLFFLKNNNYSGPRKWVLNNRLIFYVIIFFSSVASIYYGLKLGILYLSSPLFFIILFYTFSPIRMLKIIFPNLNINILKYSIRDIPFLKIFAISFSWTYLTIIIPIIINELNFDIYTVSNIIIRFLFVLAITIPFDIRDLKFDKVITIPSFFGIKKSKIIAYISLFFCEIIIFTLWIYNYLFFSLFLSLLITFEVSSLFIFFVKKDNKELFFSFYIEGLSILMFVLVYIANYSI